LGFKPQGRIDRFCDRSGLGERRKHQFAAARGVQHTSDSQLAGSCLPFHQSWSRWVLHRGYLQIVFTKPTNKERNVLHPSRSHSSHRSQLNFFILIFFVRISPKTGRNSRHHVRSKFRLPPLERAIRAWTKAPGPSGWRKRARGGGGEINPFAVGGCPSGSGRWGDGDPECLGDGGGETVED
jgi:hypothetical protein